MMPDQLITIKYDGGDAEDNSIDMRLLAESLLGLDRIISDGVIAISVERTPKRGERAPIILKINEPVTGSYEISGYLQDLAGMLAIGIPLFTQCGADLISDWVRGVIYFFSGYRDKSDKAMEAIVETQRMHLIARDASEERHHEREMKLLDALTQTRERLGNASAQAVAPVGSSVTRLNFLAGEKPQLEVDEEAAEKLREHGDVEIGDLQTMILRTDGFTFHTRKLSVEHPERAGYLLADVQDPIFKEDSNPYTMAAQKKALIKVQAKPGYRSGRLEKLYIMDFGGEVEDAA